MNIEIHKLIGEATDYDKKEKSIHRSTNVSIASWLLEPTFKSIL